MIPFDQPVPKPPEEKFKIFHSNAHITVEYAFGEIDLRWDFFGNV